MQINIAHIYPELLNQYGDTGNILTLKHRLEARGIECTVTAYAPGDEIDFGAADIVYLGGGSEKTVMAAHEALLPQKDRLKEYTEAGGVLLAVCTGYEMIGKSFECAGKVYDGLGITDTVSAIGSVRLIGDIITENSSLGFEIVGFENHLGRTNIGKNTPLGIVKYGFGNNETKKAEGVMYKNVIGTYIHGPLLPKNPVLADYIIECAMKPRNEGLPLEKLEDSFETKAHNYIVRKYLDKK